MEYHFTDRTKQLSQQVENLMTELNERNKLYTAARHRNAELADYITQLHDELHRTDRTDLIAEIERLRSKVQALTNQVRVLTAQRNEAQRAAADTHNHAWDSYKPTRAEVQEYYSIALNLLDCESEDEK